MAELIGITKANREKLSLLARSAKGVITVKDAVEVLKVDNLLASKILSKLASSGWLARIKRGTYSIVPIESLDASGIIESPWIVATRLFTPCYIGGWSALEFWGLTEQIFTTTLIFTTRKLRKLNIEIKQSKFKLHKVGAANFFGLKVIWESKVQMQVTDPTRTIVDILSDPSLAGGIRLVADAVHNYFISSHKNVPLLIEYIDKLGNRTVFKRLGFLMEYMDSSEIELIEICKERLSAGKSKLDPALQSNYLATGWKLWITASWKKDK
jgi:predicted transcriptional regulator of viral defense system